jgi:hypothetical protein
MAVVLLLSAAPLTMQNILANQAVPPTSAT